MKKQIYALLIILLISFGFGACNHTKKSDEATQTEIREVWTANQANDWYQDWGWLRGANFIPSTAINQLEMWQKETFDPKTIDRELGFAQEIGLNSMRVYLHHLAWKIDPEGFKNRMNEYLDIASKRNISTLFVFFDDCWIPTYKEGSQPEPKTGTHNSGWLQDPGKLLHDQPELMETLEEYVKDVLTAFADDQRIVLWDLYNEPGNSHHNEKSIPLLEKAFEWGREVNPSQPLSVGVWNWNLKEMSDFQIKNSDVITYHNYGDYDDHKKMIDSLRTLTQKPLLCTEYMARTRNSLFKTIMPLLKDESIGAYNWGLVAGKTNTIYAWDTPITDGSEPDIWFHDIFRKDGSPYNQDEIDLIKSLTVEE